MCIAGFGSVSRRRTIRKGPDCIGAFDTIFRIWGIVMFTVSIETRFRASHSIALPDGSQEPQHEHDWAIVAEVGSERLNDAGVVMDFARLRSILSEVATKLDNISLGELDYFQSRNPSAENVAMYVYEKIEPKLPDDVRLEFVRVGEQVGCWAKYRKDRQEP